MWWITDGCLLVKESQKELLGRSHLKTTQALVDVWEASETSHSKISLGNFQHQYLAELLVNVYSSFVVHTYVLAGCRQVLLYISIQITIIWTSLSLERIFLYQLQWLSISCCFCMEASLSQIRSRMHIHKYYNSLQFKAFSFHGI